LPLRHALARLFFGGEQQGKKCRRAAGRDATMRTRVQFYRDNRSFTRRSQMVGKKCGFYFMYTVLCCDPIKVSIQINQAHPQIKLQMRIRNEVGENRTCTNHCFAHFPDYTELFEATLSGQRGHYEFVFCLHKPFWCFCTSWVLFTVVSLKGIFTRYFIFNVNGSLLLR
jgi:hypothetical protein